MPCLSSNRSPAASTRPCKLRYQTWTTCKASKSAQRGFLGIVGIHTAADLLSPGHLIHPEHLAVGSDHPQQWRRLQAAACCLDSIAAFHPQQTWRQSAQEARQCLQDTAAELVSLTASNAQPQQQAAARAGPAATALLLLQAQQLAQRGGQLQAWGAELSDMHAAAAAAVVAIQQDPACAPVLLIDAAAAQQHPVWAAEYAATAAAAAAGGGAAHQGGSSMDMPLLQGPLPVQLPEQQQLELPGGAALHPGFWYAGAAAAAGVWISGTDTQPRQQEAETSSSSPPAEATLRWPLTAAAAKLLLSSPAGSLPEGLLQQVFGLGVVGRCMATAEGVDLARLVQEEQQGVREQLEQLRLRVASLTPGSPAGGAAAGVGRGAGGDALSVAPGCPEAAGHPAVRAAFLTELAGFGHQLAAGELQGWLDACRTDVQLRSCLQSSGAQLPADVASLQPWQVEPLRQLVAVAAANRSPSPGSAGAAAPAATAAAQPPPAQNGWAVARDQQQQQQQEWLQDYVHLPHLLPSLCGVLGGCLQLDMHCSPAAPGATWCDEAYTITVFDAQQQQQQQQRGADPLPRAKDSPGGSGGGDAAASGRGGGRLLGHLWLLFDEQHHGLPATHLVSPGAGPQHACSSTAAAPAPAGSSTVNARSREGDGGRGGAGGGAGDDGGGLQACIVAIVFPASFCTRNRPVAAAAAGVAAAGSASSSNGSSAAAVLQGVLHELGHGLHFLLSCAAAEELPDAGPWASLELCELASHVMERMARDATCLQALLRHHVTGQPPPRALTQQLLAYEAVSTRGVRQWQQHVIAALLDARLAAEAAATAAAAQGGAQQASSDGAEDVSQQVGSCWRLLQQLMAQFDPLGHAGQPSEAMLEYLPALAVVPPGQLYCYIFAELAAAAVWGRFLSPDPLDPRAWRTLRRGLFEARARAGTVAAVQQLLGAGSMRQLSVRLCAGVGVGEGGASQQHVHPGGVGGGRGGEGAHSPGHESVSGWVPDLEHPAFQDIDLW